MTDLSPAPSIPSRLGVTLHHTEGEHLVARLTPAPATCRQGRLRASAVVFLVDVVAGLQVDTDPDRWSFTSDLSLRLPDRPAPPILDARAHTLRAGHRSTTSGVDLTDDRSPFGYSIVGFARVERRAGDLDKPAIDLGEWAEAWSAIPVIDEPVREAAGIDVLDPSSGRVSLGLAPELLNPAGALQGAMVSLVAEAAAEDFSTHHTGVPHVVTELDIRFLTQARHGPVVGWAVPIGAPDDGSLRVSLVDQGNDDRLVAQVLARTVAVG